MDKYYMGVDVGSVSINIVLIDEDNKLIYKKYLRTQGKPIEIIKQGLQEIKDKKGNIKILGVGTTGSGRNLANLILGADIVKNEITSHAIASLNEDENVKTIMEIGGQDSKIIVLKDKIVVDFAMNTVCAAGTGSFLDRQAIRLGIKIEDFGDLALSSNESVRIAGRCAVFAESDMIHKQQLGHNQGSIARGLSEALVRNYLSNVGKGKEILSPIMFQGGVAANKGIKEAFEKILNTQVYIPKNYDVMGAIGIGILAKEMVKKQGFTNFRGFSICNINFKTKSFECNDCSNMCEVIEILGNNQILSRYNDKCGKWSESTINKADAL